MLAWDVEKKWLMLLQDRQAEQLASGRKGVLDTEDPDAPPPLINILAEKAGEMWTATWDAGNRKLDKHAQRMAQREHHHRYPPVISLSPSTSTGTTATTSNTNTSSTNPPAGINVTTAPEQDRYAPEFFIRKFMEADLRAVTPTLVGHLEVNLRTRPLEYVYYYYYNDDV